MEESIGHILLNNNSAKMIILEIIGGLLVLFLAAQILGRLARFVWIPILSSVIAGLVVGISNHSLWEGIGTGIAVLIVVGISSAIVGGN